MRNMLVDNRSIRFVRMIPIGHFAVGKMITESLTTFFLYLTPKIILINNFSVVFFRFKDRLPKVYQSAVVYRFSCASCGASYVGSTIRNLDSRIKQHLAKSVRTGKFLVKPDPSPIREHSMACDTLVTNACFTILDRASSSFDLRILELLHIIHHNPSLNNMLLSFPL